MPSSWVDIESAAYLMGVHIDDLRAEIDTGGNEYPPAYKRAGLHMWHIDDLKQYRDTHR